MTEKRVTDWERIELDYRAGLKTLRQIADENGISNPAIAKRAKRDDWSRDLSAKIKAKADSLVSKELVSNSVSKDKRLTEKVIVDGTAEVVAQVQIRQRKDVTRSTSLVNNLFKELESDGELLAKRIDCVKKLVDAQKVLFGMERDAYNIQSQSGGSAADTLSALMDELTSK
ncbi:MAG TPA: hypothetical protein VIH30_07465 [Aquirhabdus sp.]